MAKRILPVITLLLVIIALTSCEIVSTDDYYATTPQSTSDVQEDKDTVTIEVECVSVLSNLDDLDEALKESDLLPEDGIIIEERQVSIDEDTTAFEVLEQVIKENEIQFEYIGADESDFGTVYIKGINHLYEKSCGENSGWAFYVNEEFPSVGSDQLVLKDGDQIEWTYVCDFNELMS